MKDTSWQNVADWYTGYAADPTSYHQTLIIPNLIRVLEPRKNKIILDLACGDGTVSRALVDAGATVIGIDASSALIKHAQNASAHIVSKPVFHIASADHIPLADHTVDAAMCVLAIQNIKPVKETFAECARVLKPGGQLVLVLNHPAFRIPRGSAWGWDESAKSQYRRVDYYLSEQTVEIVAHPGQKISAATVSFHRPLQYYVKLLAAAGFAITRLEEWISPKKSQVGPRQKEEDRTRKEFPLFMLLEAKLV